MCLESGLRQCIIDKQGEDEGLDGFEMMVWKFITNMFSVVAYYIILYIDHNDKEFVSFSL